MIRRIREWLKGDWWYPQQRIRRDYLRGVPQAQPYILSTVKEISAPPEMTEGENRAMWGNR